MTRQRHSWRSAGCRSDGDAVTCRHPDPACRSGLGLAIIRWANTPLLARIVALYVSMLRATPLVTLLLLLSFALPNVGVPIGPISAAILALVMNYVCIQLRGVARLAERISQGPVRGRAGDGHARPGSASGASCAADRPRKPSRAGQRNVAPHQGDAGAGRGGVVDITRAAVRIGAVDL